jgi:hypothetical protein
MVVGFTTTCAICAYLYLCGQGKWFKTKIKIELGLWYLTPLSKMSVR